MQDSEDKAQYRCMLDDARQKLESLPDGGPVRSLIRTQWLDEIAETVDRRQADDLEWGYWPPFLLFLHRRSLPDLHELESDIGLVLTHSKPGLTGWVCEFLGARDDRKWASGLLETFVKSRLLRKGQGVELDPCLPNRKHADLRLDIGGKRVYLECTAITESDEDRCVWDKFLQARKVQPDLALVRPGKLDPPQAKGPSPYYDCLRFYAKVYDKLAPGLNPAKSQLPQDCPNVLLVSFHFPRGPLCPRSLGVGWALDELLADQPRSGGIVSLLSWLDFHANRLITEGSLTDQKYREDFDAIVAAPRRIGAILLFDGCVLAASRVNYNAHSQCRLSHREIAELEAMLQQPPAYGKA